MNEVHHRQNLSPAEKAAKTKWDRYGPEGLSAIAAAAYRTRQERHAERLNDLEIFLVRTAGAAQTRARRAGMDYDGDLAGWALATMDAQRWRCAISGVPFRLDKLGHGAAPRPFAPSIDRVDATKGYTAGNIRIVCWAANCLLGTWGDEPALEIARGMAKVAADKRVQERRR